MFIHFFCCVLPADMPDISLLQRLHRICRDTDIELDYIALGHRGEHRDVYEVEAKRVVNRLKSSQLYDMAREFANAAHIIADEITIDQV